MFVISKIYFLSSALSLDELIRLKKYKIFFKHFRLIILFSFFTTLLSAQDFRQFYWKDSLQEVKSKEGDGIYIQSKEASPDILNYTGISLGDEIWNLTYWFRNGKLIAGGYSTGYSDSAGIDMKRSLSRRYGKSETDGKWITKTTVIIFSKKPDKLTILYIDKYKFDEFKSAFKLSNKDSLDF